MPDNIFSRHQKQSASMAESACSGSRETSKDSGSRSDAKECLSVRFCRCRNSERDCEHTDVGREEDLEEGNDKVVDTLHVARIRMLHRPDVKDPFQRLQM